MLEKMIEIPLTLFLELVEAKSMLQAIKAYIKTDKYYNKDTVAELLGIQEAPDDNGQ